MKNFFKNFGIKLQEFRDWLPKDKATSAAGRHITNRLDTPQNLGRREISASQSRDTEPSQRFQNRAAGTCPHCASRNFVKRGTRKNRFQAVQLYLCRNPECGKTFTAESVKGKHFPLRVVIEGMNYYNLGFTLEETCRFLEQKLGVNPDPSTLSDWIREYEKLCAYSRLRPYAVKLCKPRDTVETVTMAHRQLYRFRYHRPKLHLLITEHFKHRQFEALKDYLDAVSAETPHQYFQEGLRMSEVRSKFDKAQMIVRAKTNYANELAKFVLQAVKENKDRHEEVQRFMIANDSVTVATEVPVYIRKEDIEHMQNQLGEAHSIRFGDHKRGLLLLEQAMTGCNKMVIYLEQAKGIYGSKLDGDLIDDLVQRYADTRTKIFRLEKSWQKWTEPKR